MTGQYETMTKGCYMPNINVFRPVVIRRRSSKVFTI